ncbi:MAG: hypothetical protein HDQ88_08950 [Clostridia bacterium]|nr:hypothetical protein [Clostridia bacterium]
MFNYDYDDVITDLRYHKRLPGTHTITFRSPSCSIHNILNDIHNLMQEKYPSYKVLAHSIVPMANEPSATTYLTFKI